MATARKLVIVGAGFSGTVLAAQLLRLRSPQPLQILLIDPLGHGRGAAYANRNFPYLLNVPAARMSADGFDPHSFLNFAKRHQVADAHGEAYLARSLYGDYLEQYLATAERGAAPHRRLSRVINAVVDLEHDEASASWRLTLRDGTAIKADTVVLATGNPPPSTLPALESLRHDERIVSDPWTVQTHGRQDEQLLVVGTGLTMADVTIAALRSGRARRVYALSRHGMLPAAQSPLATARTPDGLARSVRDAGGSVRRLTRAIRNLCAVAQLQGYDWRDVITEVRHQAPALWRSLDTRERSRFLRHVRCFWEVHRHRLPGETSAELERYRSDGRLVILGGRLREVRALDGRLAVRWRARGQDQDSDLSVDRIINGTGPDFDARRLRDPLWVALLRKGLCEPDPLGLGIRTGEHGQLLGSGAHAASELYYLGPLLRAQHWETTAVSELREYARSLATRLSDPIHALAAVV